LGDAQCTEAEPATAIESVSTVQVDDDDDEGGLMSIMKKQNKKREKKQQEDKKKEEGNSSFSVFSCSLSAGTI
jgi:hypothetical protein